LLVLLQRLTGQLGASFFAAALFILHPTHVESVAWVSERKDVLSTFFGLLSLLAYARYAQRPLSSILHPPSGAFGFMRSPAYWMTFGLLALGLMSKPMLVTWPVLMLLLDFWPLGRWNLAAVRPKPAVLVPLVVEKLPLLALVGAISAVTIMTQHGSEAVISLGEFSAGARVANTLHSLGIYVFQFIWPANLAPFYPLQSSLPPLRVLGAALLLLAVSGAALWAAPRRPWVTTGWFWFLITILPVSGLLQAGWQAHADRYLYVPSIGLGLVAIWGWNELMRKSPAGREWGIGLGLAVLGVFSWLTFAQAQRWQNSEALFTHALAVTKDNFIAHQSLGEELLKQDRIADARAHFTTALALNPRLHSVRNNLAVMLLQGGQYAQAEVEFAAVLKEQPKFQLARFNYGKALEGLERYAEAALAFQTFLTDRPDDVEARLALVRCLSRLGRNPEAFQALQEGIERQPAVTQFYTALAVGWLGRGDFAKAVQIYEAGLQASPDSVELLNNSAWLLATHPQARRADADQAVSLAERASTLTAGEIPFVLGTCAAAYAAAERFADAITTAERAIELARATGQTELANRNAELLQLYRAGKPYRETPPENETAPN